MLQNSNRFEAKKNKNSSPIWKDILGKGIQRIVGNDKQIRFWLYNWVGDVIDFIDTSKWDDVTIQERVRDCIK